MKKAVVFYSSEGNCAFVAEQIAAQMGADLLQLHTRDDKKRSRVGRFFAACAMVFIQRRPALKPFAFEPSAYDLIVIGAPVWAYSPAPPIQTFLSQAGIAGKKIALFVSHAGGGGRALEKFGIMLPGNEIIAQMDFANPISNYESAKRQIAEWVRTIAGHGAPRPAGALPLPPKS